MNDKHDEIKRISKQMWLAGEERELWRQVYLATLEHQLDQLDASSPEEFATADQHAGLAAVAAVVRYQRNFAGDEGPQSVRVGGNDEQH